MFKFSISDLGHFLNKSPVTIRAWERKGLIRLPREGGTRVLGIHDVERVARIAHQAKRISDYRLLIVVKAIESLDYIEKDNQR